DGGEGAKFAPASENAPATNVAGAGDRAPVPVADAGRAGVGGCGRAVPFWTRGAAARITSGDREHLLRVLARSDLREDLRDPAFLVDHEGRPLVAPVLPAVHRLLLPDPVRLGDLVVGIGEE